MRRYFDDHTPNIKWNIGDNLGNKFEDFVANVIKMQLHDLHPQVKTIQTSRTADGGKDIIVTSEINDLVIPTSASNIESMFEASNARGSIVINHEPSNYYRFLYYNIQNITIKGDCSESFKQTLLNTRNDDYV